MVSGMYNRINEARRVSYQRPGFPTLPCNVECMKSKPQFLARLYLYFGGNFTCRCPSKSYVQPRQANATRLQPQLLLALLTTSGIFPSISESSLISITSTNQPIISHIRSTRTDIVLVRGFVFAELSLLFCFYSFLSTSHHPPTQCRPNPRPLTPTYHPSHLPRPSPSYQTSTCSSRASISSNKPPGPRPRRPHRWTRKISLRKSTLSNSA